MASEANMLRKVAAELRAAAKQAEQAQMAKTAEVLQAAAALEKLRRKVRPNDA